MLYFVFIFLVQFECGASTSENGTYFVSPSTPERICNFQLTRASDDICQVGQVRNIFSPQKKTKNRIDPFFANYII